jgi:ATP-binding cassette subfamily F protein uup
MLILKGEKIGIIGGNGTGKSTFIKLLLDELQSDSGMIRRSKTIKLAYTSLLRALKSLHQGRWWARQVPIS